MASDRINTNFYDRQAAENAKGGGARGVFVVLGLIAVGGIGFGGYQLFNYFSHFDFINLKRNVTIELREPKIIDHKAVVACTMRNFNACDISNPSFSYEIDGKDGKPI